MIAIIGGSGFYELFEKAAKMEVKTPYGRPSAKIALGKINKTPVVFLPRHGENHEFPPHKINYRANLWALKKLGVKRIISFTAGGSLQKKINRGDFVVVDQFIDRTSGRISTFYDGPETVHISSAYSYCPQLSRLAYKTGKDLGFSIHPEGTLVVIEGPRFSTAAESAWFSKMGWSVINMTGYPEAVLAKELELCYASIALVTDYDAGIIAKEKLSPVSANGVSLVFGENIENAKNLMAVLVGKVPQKRNCACGQSLVGAKIKP